MQSILTIVIPTYNEENYIIRTLDEIKKQEECKEVQIIVADANSTDKTIELIQQKYPEVKIIEGGLPAKGRNEGAKLVKTEFILFLDADVTFSTKRAIKKALTEMIRKKRDMVSTTPMYKGELDIRAWIMFRINWLTTWLLSFFSPFAIGGFTMIRINKFKELGGYNEQILQTEDWILSRQIAPAKFGLLSDLITQDNRRFKRYGYFNMIKLMFTNFFHLKNDEYFKTGQNYWT